MSSLLRGEDGQAAPKTPKPSASGKGKGDRKRGGNAVSPAAPAAPSQAAQGSTAGSAAAQASVKELSIQVAQLGLSAMSSVRTLQAICIETLMIDRQLKYTVSRDNEEVEVCLVDKIKQTTKAHYDALQHMDQDKDHQALGPPLPHVWMELVQWVAGKYSDVNVEEQHQGEGYNPGKDVKAVRSYLSLVESAPQKARLLMVTNDIKHCRIAKTYTKVQVKLEVSLDHHCTQTTLDCWTALKRLLKALGAQAKTGAAPRGNAERVVSRLLGELGRARTDDWEW
eukprot:TRINITY_DN85278_c0_g1_i1.p2 TRINITY_DN85278_c0_g1~~TRINITY_DN85278_c0_g1_i1.p2  ORF type:complete len:282 (+),score=69.81 TRINITY_DN85278_c0_g1_i1:110-955(+)